MTNPLTRPKILIVDDKPENLIALAKLLRSLDVEVIQASSGEQALSQILRNRFAIVLLDVQMPDMDGFETAQLIRANKTSATTPIIFVTALSKDERHMAMGYESGAVDYLYKPINPIILLSKVKVFLQLEQQRLSMQVLTEQLQHSNQTNQLLLTSASQGIIGINIDGEIEFANPAATTLLREDEQVLSGTSLFPWFYDPALDAFVRQWKSQPDTNASYHQSCRMRRKTGDSKPVELHLSPMCNHLGRITGGVLVFHDITDRLRLEDHLRQMAHYDHLTGLANRALLMEFLQSAVARGQRRERNIAVLVLDLDHFKQVNDTLGHDAGDELLTSVAERLHNCVREGDLIARLGGDEFAIVLDDIARIDDVALIAAKIVSAISKPHKLKGRELHVSTSVGIATYPENGKTPTELLKAADTAMYVTKKAGRHGYRLFTADMHKESQRRAHQEHVLKNAVHNGQFELLYQPMVALDSGQIVAYEAQLSWLHNNIRQSQDEFLPMVESLGLMKTVGQWTLDNLCREIAGWCGHDDQRRSVVFSVNLAISQCQSAELAQQIEQLLNKYGLSPSQLELRISERIANTVTHEMINALESLRSLGVHIALDNFGSGVSALNYLRKLPVDVINVDKLYIQEIGRDQRIESILKALTGLAHDMGIRAVAKGVESPLQLQLLEQLGYDRVQGMLLGQPESIIRIDYDAYNLSCVKQAPSSNSKRQ